MAAFAFLWPLACVLLVCLLLAYAFLAVAKGESLDSLPQRPRPKRVRPRRRPSIWRRGQD